MLSIFLLTFLSLVIKSKGDSEWYPDVVIPQQDEEDYKDDQLSTMEGKKILDYMDRLSMNEPEPSFTFRSPEKTETSTFDQFAVRPDNPAFNDPGDWVTYQQVNNNGKQLVKETSTTYTTYDSPDYPSINEIPLHDDPSSSSLTFLAVVIACSAAGVLVVAVVGFISYRLQKNAKAAEEVEYPAYGVTGPNKDISPSSTDRRLAQSAQMYHYQHQKQQIIAMERASAERRTSLSDAESDEENGEGDYTVYECPGLASTGEMEIKNPLFLDESTLSTTPGSPSAHNAK